MSGSAPLAMKTPQPDLVASLAAEILLTMPPTAVSLVVPPAMASISGVILSTTGTTRPVPFMSIEPGRGGEDEEELRPDEARDHRREGVVVAEADPGDLGRAHGVVLVDDGDGAVGDQLARASP